MDIAPKKIAGKSTTAEKNFIGNKLYALAHRRGWDYSSLVELLIDDKGKSTPTVKEIDQLLVEKFGARHTTETIRRKGEQRDIKKIQTTCMGELAECHHALMANQKKREKQSAADTDTEEVTKAIQQAEIAYDSLHAMLNNAGMEEIKDYIAGRLKLAGVNGGHEKAAMEHVLVMLGLNVGTQLHKDGVLYSPHRNRHRNEFVKELKETMRRAFNEPSVKQKAEQQATAQKIPADKARENWLKNAVAILDPNNPECANAGKSRKKNNRDVRPARFENRHVGKCPAKRENGARCNHNLPKKSRADIRALQFEIEARQMNLKDGDDLRKLHCDELQALLGCVDFAKASLADNGAKWNKFFAEHKTPPVEGDARGKKEILKDIAAGGQTGRTGLCKTHLQEKLKLLESNQTESDAWAQLHQERMLSIYTNDAPPSIRQKVEVVIGAIKKSLKKRGYNLNNLPIEHIGIETARFDISALAQNEGKKFTRKKTYQKKSSRSIDALKEEQGGKCLYCGGAMGFATVDHIFAKAAGGGDKGLNRAAAHDICNINKGKYFVRPNAEVLAHIKTANPKKYKYIKKYMDDANTAAVDSLAGAQHTMFGAKLLKGSLITALGLSQLSAPETKKIFPQISPREIAYLRNAWFWLMNRQKSAVRYTPAEGTGYLKVEVGAKKPVKPLTIKWGKTLPANVVIEQVRPEKNKACFKFKNARENQGRITLVDVNEKHPPKRGDEGVYSCRFHAVDKDTGEQKQYRNVHIVVEPAEGDAVREFHHAVDAVVCAAAVEWDKLTLIDNKLRTGDPKYHAKIRSAVKDARPEIDLESIRVNGYEELIAPKKSSFFRDDKQDKSRPKFSKTDTQALRVKRGEITQRMGLHKIAGKNFRHIKSHRIKTLMLDAFAAINSGADDDKKKYLSKSQKDVFITQEYFLHLPPTHYLHPINTRSARCAVLGTGENQMFKIVDPKNGGEHSYKRTVSWGKAVVYEYVDGGKKKIDVARFKQSFYVNKHNPQTILPEGAKTLREFARGDRVRIDDAKNKGAEWKISKLGNSATLLPQNDVAEKLCAPKKEKTAAYKKLLKLQ